MIFIIFLFTIISSFTIEQKRLYLDTHNYYRRKCASGTTGGTGFPSTASFMDYMIWDYALEQTASTRASFCYNGHLNGKNGATDIFELYKSKASFHKLSSHLIGENIAIYYQNNIKDFNIFNQSIFDWYTELNNIDWTTNHCFGECGHFLQLCNAETRYIGCSYSFCKSIHMTLEPEYKDGGVVFICNYYPSYIIGKYPFNNGLTNGCWGCNGRDAYKCDSYKMCIGGFNSNYYASLGSLVKVEQCTDNLGRNISNVCLK